MNPTLSHYFPPDTTYFYGYPAGTDSQFYNGVSPDIEELVSARPLVCAGTDLRIAAFAASTRDDARALLQEAGTAVIPRDRILPFPENISCAMTDTAKRNAAIEARVASRLKRGVW